jgi:DNA polymerase
MPGDDPEAFRQFGEYCRQDVETERAAHKVLHAFELDGEVLESFQFDLRMNDLGVPVNVEALKRADKMINEYSGRLTRQFREITGLNPTQRDKAHKWLRARGYPYPNLQAGNVDEVLANGRNGWQARYIEIPRERQGEEWLEENPDKPLPAKFTAPKLQPVEMTEEAFEALRIRSLVSFAAVKKVPTMLNAVCPDGRVRGALMWSGAERTHRWAGRIIQPQNFRRPSFKGTEQAYKMLCEGADIDTLEMLFAPFLEIIASCIRHFIQLPDGQQMLQADYSAVEARGNPWLCGAEQTLQLFRDEVPVYELMAAKIFGIDLSQVTTDERFVGKQAILGCGYNMGRPKFRGTCESYNFTPPESMVDEFKPRFRKQLAMQRNRAEIPEPWDEFEVKFPGFIWARNRNGKDGRTFGVYAYRKATPGKSAVVRKIADPDNPTAEEWLDLTYDDLADRAVTTWRTDNPEIVQAWKHIDTAAKDAIKNPGKVFKATPKISFGVTEKPGFRALVMRLPSGHTLVYPQPKLVWKGDNPTPDWSDYYNIEIHFWGKVPMKSTWGWCKTYGGKLLENATQAVCGDLMAHGAVNASKHGYNAFMLVHDEMLAAKEDGQELEELCRLICELPKWAKGMPLAADGNVIPFYMKT